MSRVQRTSAVAGLVLAAALVLTPAAQASGRPAFVPTPWLEAGFARLAGWWERTWSPVGPTTQRSGGEKIGLAIDPDGVTSAAPAPAWTPDERSEIGTGIDPNG